MGVIGLTTFIDKNTHLLQKHQLRGCSVVVDGNNLYHHVYRACGVEARFGGDYDVYRQQLRINFKSLLKCGVTPYVVLDGGYTPDNKKLKKCLQRAKERVVKAHIAQVKGECRMLPLLAYDTFIQTLEELDIPHVTCQFEADGEIAKLANRLECPVISNDSDFFIFDLTHGFLPLDYLDFNPLSKRNPDGSKSPPFLHCQMYNVDSFLEAFEGLNRSMLPVLATLLGNDYTPPSAFQKVDDEMLHAPRKKHVHVSPKVTKVLKLIRWLATHCGDPDNVMDCIKPYIRGQSKFWTSVEGYAHIDAFEGCDLFSYFSKKRETFVPVAAPNFSGFNGSAFPDWFLTAICKGQITPAVINAAVLHRVIFLTQVEDLTSPTIYLCSEHVRRVVYGILMASDPLAQADGSGLEGGSNGLTVMGKGAYKAGVVILGDNDEGGGGDEDSGGGGDKDSGGGDEEDGGGDKDSGGGDEDDGGGDSNSKQAINIEDEKGLRPKSDNEDQGLIDEMECKYCHPHHDNDREMKCDCDKDEEEVVEILCDHGDETIAVAPQVRKQTMFEEYHREIRHLKKSYLGPVVQSVADGDELPSLSAIEDLNKERRLAILLHSLEVDASVLNGFCPRLQVFVSGVVTWVRRANPPVSLYHLDCAILCPILLHMLHSPPNSRQGKSSLGVGNNASLNGLVDKEEGGGGVEETEGGGCIDLDLVCHRVKVANKNKFYTVRDNLDRYRTMKSVFSRRKGSGLECQTIHAFTQLQSCLYEISNLNKILRYPLPALQPALLINGTFLYNFYKDLVSRPVSSNFLDAMTLKGSDLHDVFLRIKSVVLEAVGGDSLFAATPLAGDKTKKRRKKNKGKKPKKEPCEEAELMKADGNCWGGSGEEEEEVTTLQGFDIQNRFSLLTL